MRNTSNFNMCYRGQTQANKTRLDNRQGKPRSLRTDSNDFILVEERVPLRL